MIRTSEIVTDPLYGIALDVHDRLRQEGLSESDVFGVLKFATLITDLNLKRIAKEEDARRERIEVEKRLEGYRKATVEKLPPAYLPPADPKAEAIAREVSDQMKRRGLR